MSIARAVNQIDWRETLGELDEQLAGDDLRRFHPLVTRYSCYEDQELWVIWNFACQKARQSRAPLPKRLARKVRRDYQGLLSAVRARFST